MCTSGSAAGSAAALSKTLQLTILPLAVAGLQLH